VEFENSPRDLLTLFILITGREFHLRPKYKFQNHRTVGVSLLISLSHLAESCQQLGIYMRLSQRLARYLVCFLTVDEFLNLYPVGYDFDFLFREVFCIAVPLSLCYNLRMSTNSCSWMFGAGPFFPLVR